jgi:hypothetical protein
MHLKLIKQTIDEAFYVIYYLYITFLTAFITSSALGNHSFNKTGE